MVRFTVTLMIVALFVAGASAQPAAIDISSAFNFDAVASQTELDTALAWHTAGMGDGTDYTLMTVFGETGTGDFHKGADHNFINPYSAYAYLADGTAAGLDTTVTTPYGTYTLGAFEGNQDLAALSLGSNAVRMGTLRGKYETDVDASATVTIGLAAGDQAMYSSINLLMTGISDGAITKDNYGVDVPKKRAWTRVTAHYGDGTSEQVWESPKGGSYTHTNDVTYDIAGGIPIGTGFVDAGLTDPDVLAAVWDPAYIASFNTVQVATIRTHTPGGGTIESPRYSASAAADMFMYDVGGGIAVDPAKTLTAVEILVTNEINTWASGYVEGDNINVYAMVATPAGGTPVLQADFDGNGEVDLDDFVILKGNFGIGTTHAEGDADGNGAVDLDDFVILKTEFGT